MTCIIGIPQPGQGLLRKYMKSKYVQTLTRAGAQIRWIELEDVDAAVSAALECDGLLLAGGADVDPHLYGQEPTEKCGKPDVLRDTAETRILEAFLPTGKPILGICRGMQLLNIHCGGTMYQDITGTQVCRHTDWLRKNKGSHSVKILPRTRLSQIFTEEKLTVNSLHHQAVDRVGPGLTVSAVSEDGFIEGLELFLHPFCVGVQWHPEHMSKYAAGQQRLVDTFIEACRK